MSKISQNQLKGTMFINILILKSLLQVSAVYDQYSETGNSTRAHYAYINDGRFTRKI
jgi:hypothetical protein